MNELLSTKDFNLQGEFLLVNQIKEETSFLSSSKEDFIKNMDLIKKNKKLSEFALPNYNQVKTGFILERSN